MNIKESDVVALKALEDLLGKVQSVLGERGVSCSMCGTTSFPNSIRMKIDCRGETYQLKNQRMGRLELIFDRGTESITGLILVGSDNQLRTQEIPAQADEDFAAAVVKIIGDEAGAHGVGVKSKVRGTSEPNPPSVVRRRPPVGRPSGA